MKRYKYFFFILILSLGILIPLLTVNCGRSAKKIQVNKEIDYNLVFITIDTLRPDRLGCYGFPNADTPSIDQLAETGVLFKHCFSPVPLALPAYSSIFTGKSPLSHGVRNNISNFLSENEVTLAEVLNNSAFQTHAVVSLPALMGKFGLNQGFQVYDDSLDFRGGSGLLQNQVKAESVYNKFKSWFSRNREKDERFFSWIHFSDPQAPYAPEGQFKDKFPEDPYSGEIAAVDYYVGKILNDLKSQQLLDKTLIVLTGANGEAFGEHNEYGHGVLCYNESLEVPLIISNPVFFEQRKVLYSRVSVLDIMPTVMELFSIEMPSGGQGESLVTLFTEEKENLNRDSHFYFESMLGKEDMNLAPVHGIISGSYKYIALPDAELYDIDKDPLEKENLLKQNVQLTEQISRQFREYTNSVKTPLLATAGLEENKTGVNSLDPKQGLPLINRVIKVKKLIGEKSIDEAENELDNLQLEFKVLSSDSPFLYENRHDLLRFRGNNKGAEEVLEKGITAFPQVRGLKIKLAVFFVETNQKDRAESICQKILVDNPRDTEAGIILRRVYKETGKVDDTVLKYYKDAITLEPNNAMLRVEYASILQNMGKNDAVLEIASTLMEDELLMNDTGSLDIKTNIGMLLLRMGQFDRTITLCLYMISQGQKNPEVLNQLGKAYSGKNEFDNALDAYNKALEIDDKNSLTLSNLGTLNLTLFRAQRDVKYLSRALEFYSRSLDSNPQMLTALNGLAVAYSFLGKPDKSVEYWQKALELEPQFSDVYFNLGITYLRMKKKKDALKYLNLLKNRFYSQLNPREQQQLDSLIKEASI